MRKFEIDDVLSFSCVEILPFVNMVMKICEFDMEG